MTNAAALVLATITIGSISGSAEAAGPVALPPAGAGQAAVCPALNGKALTHQNDVTTNETWDGDGTVHRVAFGITVRPGATLTLAPCAVVSVNPGLVLTVSGTPAAPAKLVSQGTAARPVLVTSAVAGQPWGMWRGLTAQSTFDLSYTVFENGGRGGFHGTALSIRGGGPSESAAVPVLRAIHLTIRNAVGTGLVMESGAAFTADSTDLTITGGGGTVQGGDYAIEINPIAAGTLPTLNIAGNSHDAIRVAATSLFISRDLTLKDRGFPYYFVFDRVRVADANGTTPTLTIEPGVQVRFDDTLQIGVFGTGTVNQPGRLLALGTVAKPIVFTSSKSMPAAGDWPGVHLMNAAGSRLENVRIEYAGGPNGISSSNCKPAGSTDAAALFIANTASYMPAAGDFAGVTIANSKSHGINAMWTASGSGPDVTGGFTFEAINGCRQTRNRMTNGCVPSVGCLVPGTAVAPPANSGGVGGAADPRTAGAVPIGPAPTPVARTPAPAASPNGVLTTPIPNAKLPGGAVTFSWAAGLGATNYWLDVGTALGQGNIAASGAVPGLSHAVSGLPTDGSTVYVQLWTFSDGLWRTPLRYTFTASGP